MIAPAMPAGIEIMAGFGGDGVEHEITLGTKIAAESGLGDGGRLGRHGDSNYTVIIHKHFYRGDAETQRKTATNGTNVHE
jgi:hypothetical protein